MKPDWTRTDEELDRGDWEHEARRDKALDSIDEKSPPGSWADHIESTAKFRAAHAGKLSDRLRPGVEAAPWVIEEVKRLEALVPPETDRAGVGQGSWSVFAEKVVAERDAALTEIAALREEVERLRAENERMRVAPACAKDLIAVMRMPNIEYVADAHNAAVAKLQKALRGEGE